MLWSICDHKPKARAATCCNSRVKNHVVVTLVALVALVAGGCGDSGDDTPRAATTAARPRADTVQVRVGDAAVRAEVADDDAERARGLSGRSRLARDAGMYFVLPSTATRFWMKGMRFPLDMVWIRGDRVVDVSARVPNPRPRTPESKLPIYSSSKPADRVLEVNAGWAKDNGVRNGDEVSLSEAPGG